MKNKVTGIVLAGGSSSRFSFHKAFATYEGEYFYERAVSCLAPIADDVILVALSSHLQKMSATQAHVIQDTAGFAGQGPLAGILSGMEKSGSEWFAVITCDMPFVTTELFSELIHITSSQKGIQAVVPVVGDRNQPLAAVYHTSCAPVILKLLQEGKRSMNHLLRTVNTLYIDEGTGCIEPNLFININTDEEYEQHIGREKKE